MSWFERPQDVWFEYKIGGITTTSLEEATELADGGTILRRRIIATQWREV